MKRRDFLKYVGLAIACPTQLLKNKKLLTHPVDILLDLGMTNGKLMGEMREFCDEPVFRIVGPESCAWQFGSVGCDYKGNDVMCSKSFINCKAKNNISRFGGHLSLKKK